jgi:ABC-type antimicrobial peptide transport system permease subunit
LVAFTVTRRTSEIGIRVALGARRFDVVRLVLSQTALTLVIGLVLGVGGALVIARVLSSIVYEVSAHDPATFVGMSAVLLSCGLSAGYFPTRRAIRMDPADTLRRE